MKMTTRISFLLLIAVLCTITLASAGPGGLSGSNVNSSNPGPWTRHLVVQLVKRTELNREQVQIILDAVSLSRSDLIAASRDTGPIKVKADNALQDLRRRALAAFPKNEVADLFDNLNDGQSEQEILKNYYELSALTLKGRKASFRRAAANNKSVLWRTHFALYLINHPELNEGQKETILAAMSLATPDYFAVLSNSPDWKTKVRERSRLLENQIVAAFSLDEAAKIFATLGDDTQAAKPDPASSSPALLKSVNYKPLGDSSTSPQWTHTRVSQVVPENSCTCSTVSDYCPIWSVCRSNGCSETQSGCGTLWNHPCNGGCG